MVVCHHRTAKHSKLKVTADSFTLWWVPASLSSSGASLDAPVRTEEDGRLGPYPVTLLTCSELLTASGFQASACKCFSSAWESLTFLSCRCNNPMSTRLAKHCAGESKIAMQTDGWVPLTEIFMITWTVLFQHLEAKNPTCVSYFQNNQFMEVTCGRQGLRFGIPSWKGTHLVN